MIEHFIGQERRKAAHEAQITNEINETLDSLLVQGARITPDGKLVEEDFEEDYLNIEPATNQRLGFWIGEGKFNFVVGEEKFEPFFALANFVKNKLLEEGLLALKDGRINHRFRTERVTAQMLINIATTQGQGKIQKPNPPLAA